MWSDVIIALDAQKMRLAKYGIKGQPEVMTPAKQQQPTTIHGTACRLFELLLSKAGVVATLLVIVVCSIIGMSWRIVEMVGPDAANWLRTSAESTAALKDTVVLLAQNMRANTDRIDQQDRRLAMMEEKLDADLRLTELLVKEGTEPAKELVKEFREARQQMAPAVESRVQTQRVMEGILKLLERHPKFDESSDLFHDRRGSGGESKKTKQVQGGHEGYGG